MFAGSELQKENDYLKVLVERQAAQIEQLSAQVKWFQNQLFGQKSEKRFVESSPDQLHLGQQFQDETAPAKTKTIKEHQRKKRTSTDGDNQKLFFDETTVPVETVETGQPGG